MEATPALGPTSDLAELDIDLIVPNRAQPRKDFDEAELHELAQSLGRDGVLQPIVVRPVDRDHYELIAGERRWRAAQVAGLLRVPAVIKEVSDDRMLELALIENIQRSELNPIEEANAYQTLMHDLGLTQEELAERVGKPRATIANFVRLLNLPLEAQHYVKSGQLTSGHAKALAGLTRTDLQIELAHQIAKRAMSVREAERLVAAARKAATTPPKVRVAPHPDPNLIAAAEELQRVLGTKVMIVQTGKEGAGRIELHAFSAEEMNRLYELLRTAGNQAN
jgi:ParB family chromosome partitioning protein